MKDRRDSPAKMRTEERTYSLSGAEKPGWWALVFTPFIGFVFLDPWQHGASPLKWTLTIAGVLAFYALYSYAIAFSHTRRTTLSLIGGVALLGYIFAPFNLGAALYIIYATSFVPYAVEGEAKATAKYIGIILALVFLETWLLNLGAVFWGYSLGYSVILGFGNSWAARQMFAVERMAKVAERERIARDLHDVLGHALSVVILKSELAGRLVDRDPERAKAEIGDVERISREALAEVRRTISGYRSENLETEFEHAKATLETAGVAVEAQSSKVPMTPGQETVLALALREAVTNVVRHAQAKKCRLSLREDSGVCLLEVQDDGCGGVQVEGSGLRGMRERIEALGGSVARESREGTRLTITLPITASSGDGAV